MAHSKPDLFLKIQHNIGYSYKKESYLPSQKLPPFTNAYQYTYTKQIYHLTHKHFETYVNFKRKEHTELFMQARQITKSYIISC